MDMQRFNELFKNGVADSKLPDTKRAWLHGIAKEPAKYLVIETKYDGGYCIECHRPMKKGEQALYCTRPKRIWCEDCGMPLVDAGYISMPDNPEHITFNSPTKTIA
ncbi:MAG TPA: hypothetical protein V6C86_24255 [Oculatellaceae cyanobacterium]